jgi:hypothetical protein
MDYKQTLKDIKVLLGMEKAEETTETVTVVEEDLPLTVELKETKLKDGTLVKIDSLEVEGLIYAIAEDGTEIALPTGSYELEDGTMIDVTDGVIKEIAPEEKKDEPKEPKESKDEAPAENSEEVPKVDPTAPSTPTTDEVSPEATPKPDSDPVTEERIASLEGQVISMKSLLEEIIGVLNMVSTDMKSQKEKIAEISNSPAASPVTHKEEKKPEPLTVAEIRMAAITNLRKNLK